MPPSAASGQGMPGDPSRTLQPGPYPCTADGSSHAPPDAGLSGVLRDAVKAIEHRWRGMPGGEGGGLDLAALEAALGDLRVFCTWLSECCRLHAVSDPAPEVFAQAALVHAAARFLHQAWMTLAGTRACTGCGPWEAGSPAGLGAHDARRAVARLRPAADVDEEALELLAGASSALAGGAGALAGEAPGLLPAVQASIRAAAGQLRAARLSAVTAQPTGIAGQPGPVEPDVHAGSC
jgi:hypothetical protein